MARPIVVLCPVRNSEHDLRRSLPVWSRIADHIVLADQASDDRTREVAAQFPKARVVPNPGIGYDEQFRNRILIEAGREFSSNAIFFCLDADELPSANIVNSPEWQRFQTFDPGTAGVLRWVNFFRTTAQYIARGPGSPGPNRMLFVDDGRPFKAFGKIHTPRGVGVDAPRRIFLFHDVVALHYGLLDFEALIVRNHFYKAHYLVGGARGYALNNRNHSWFYAVGDEDLATSPPVWLEGWMKDGLDVTSMSRDLPGWHAIQVLRWMKDLGVRHFHRLDIWNVDWEAYRQSALEAGLSGIPEAPIEPPARLRRVLFEIASGRALVTRKLARALGMGLWHIASW